jgi:hypothetical protein
MAQTTEAATTIPAPATVIDLSATGKVTAIKNGQVVFCPANTSYELYLNAPSYTGPVNKPLKGTVRVTARKVWTVPSGGNFIAPIFGPPRIIQGRVRALTARQIIVQAGTLVVVDLPDEDIIFDLATGAIAVGKLVNVTALPGASFEIAL